MAEMEARHEKTYAEFDQLMKDMEADFAAEEAYLLTAHETERAELDAVLAAWTV